MHLNNQIFKVIIALFAIGFFFTSCDEETPVDLSTIFSETELYNDDDELVERITTIKDQGEGVGTMTFTSDRTWVLDGFVFVNEGQTLTIQPGTIIKGKSGQGENASALIVARGGTINAAGTAAKPIVFTAESDGIRYNPTEDAVENGGNLPATARGLWGGVILLGSAGLNSTPGETSIEGIPTTEPRGLYGGSNDAHSIGTFTYISIRHGGTDIGAGNEINGCTMGGVGSGSTIHHVEVIANKDDGFEWFGGTANAKYLASIYCADDALDYDEGYRGKNQYVLVLQDPANGDRGGEHDGGTDPEDGTPLATPWFFNVTSMGKGVGAGNRAITMRDNAGGEYHNSIFMGYDKGVDVELLASGQHSYQRFVDGDLKIMDNIFWNVAGNDPTKIFTVAVVEGKEPTTADSTAAANALVNAFGSSNNQVADPMFTGVIPSNGGPAGTSTGLSGDGFIENNSYKGAFDPSSSSTWLDGWSLADELGLLD